MRYRHVRYRYTVYASGGPMLARETLWYTARLGGIVGPAHFRPDTDVRETAGALEVLIDVAGVSEDDVDVQLFEDALVVEGRRQLPGGDEDARYLVAAIRQGPFRVEIPLHVAVDPEAVAARYENGLLCITLPKTGASGAGR